MLDSAPGNMCSSWIPPSLKQSHVWLHGGAGGMTSRGTHSFFSFFFFHQMLCSVHDLKEHSPRYATKIPVPTLMCHFTRWKTICTPMFECAAVYLYATLVLIYVSPLCFSPPHIPLRLVTSLHIGKDIFKYVFLLHYSSFVYFKSSKAITKFASMNNTCMHQNHCFGCWTCITVEPD